MWIARPDLLPQAWRKHAMVKFTLCSFAVANAGDVCRGHEDDVNPQCIPADHEQSDQMADHHLFPADGEAGDEILPR